MEDQNHTVFIYKIKRTQNAILIFVYPKKWLQFLCVFIIFILGGAYVSRVRCISICVVQYSVQG